MKGIGRLFSIGIAKETTRGTAISSASWWLPFADAAIEEKFDNVTKDEAYGIIEDSVGQLRVKNWVEGTLKVPLTDGSLPLLLFSQFGANADAAHGAEAAVYDHKATVGESAQHQSLTLFIHDTLSSVDYNYALGVIHKTELDVELKKFAELTLSVKAQKGVSQSSFSPSITAENRFLPQYMAFNLAPTTSGLLKPYTCTGTASSSVHVTALSISTDLLQVGMTVSGTNIPSGTTISAIVSNTAFDMSQASTGAAGTLYIGSLNTYTATGTSTIHVTALGINTNLLQVGMSVIGTNVPAGATIVKIVSSTAFDLSAATTGALSSLTFGPNVVQLKSFKLTIDGSIEDDEVLGNVAPVDFLNKEFKVEGTFECIWQNESDAKTFALATPVTPEAVLVNIVNTDVTIGTAANPTVAITLDQVYFTEFSRPIKVKDLVYQTVKFKATYSTTNTEMIKIVTTNATASY